MIYAYLIGVVVSSVLIFGMSLAYWNGTNVMYNISINSKREIYAMACLFSLWGIAIIPVIVVFFLSNFAEHGLRFKL